MVTSHSIHFPQITKFHSSLWLNNTSCWFVHHIFFIHWTVDGNLGWFHSLVIVNSAVINMGAQVSPLHANLYSLGYMPKSGIAG
jgi:hypothetical protein